MIVLLLFILAVKSQCTASGRSVTVSGYIMDNFCIDRGTLLDKPSIKTLENPAEHTIHCLIDVPQCIDSGYAILAPPNRTSTYSVLYQLGQEATGIVIEECTKLRRKGASQNVTMTFSGIDDGSSTLKCVQLVAGGSSAGIGKAGIDIQQIRAVHGSLMFIAWIVLVPLGIIIARYFKNIGHSWFLAHSIILSLACLATIISGFVIFWGMWPSTTFHNKRDKVALTHASIGVIILGLVFIQPILGLFANFYYDAKRLFIPIFPDKIHWIIGRILLILSIVNIGIGITIFDTFTTAWIICTVLILSIYLLVALFLEFRNKHSH